MKFSSALRCGVALLVVMISVSDAVGAQTARFTGRVVDPQGYPVADVTITLQHMENGQVVEISSDKDGKFFRRALSIGPYDIIFEKEGFVTVRDRRRLGSGVTNHEAVLQPMFATNADPSSSPEYVEAYEAFSAGDRETVIAILNPLVEREPQFVPGFLLLSRAHFELGHWDEAIVGYRRVVELNSEIVLAHLDLGVALVEKGELEQAEASFAKALKLEPDDATVYYNIGAIYVRVDRIDEAVSHLARATEIDPANAVAHKALAFALVRASDTAGAIHHLERYLALEPDAPDAAEMASLLEGLRGS